LQNFPFLFSAAGLLNMSSDANEPLFAGIYFHHGGVKMRESSLAQGREVTKDYIIENISSSESPSFQGSASDLSIATSNLTTHDPSIISSLPSDAPNHFNDFRFAVGNHPPPTEPFVNICNNFPSNSDESSEVFLTNGVHEPSDESPTSVVSGNFYEDIQLLRKRHQSADDLDDDSESPIGFNNEIDSSELDSLSSPSENFLYAEIEKSLDSSRDDLITESIELELIPSNKRKSAARQKMPPTDEKEGGGLEVSGILKDLDKGASLDPEGMLGGYGPQKSGDEVDEGLAGSESLPSTPSGYHSYTTEATLPKPHPQAPPEPVAEPPKVQVVSRLQRMDALDDESVANTSEQGNACVNVLL
jgi:hypothetical protein